MDIKLENKLNERRCLSKHHHGHHHRPGEPEDADVFRERNLKLIRINKMLKKALLVVLCLIAALVVGLVILVYSGGREF